MAAATDDAEDGDMQANKKKEEEFWMKFVSPAVKTQLSCDRLSDSLGFQPAPEEEDRLLQYSSSSFLAAVGGIYIGTFA